MTAHATPPAVTLLVPVYNEAGALNGLAAGLRRVMAVLPAGSEAILVDDGSTDAGARRLPVLADKCGVRLLRHDRNRGYGAALKTALGHARTEWVAIADADGTYPLEDLGRLLDRVADGADMAVGARPVRQQPWVRRPAKVFLNAFASYLAGAEIPDLNSGLRVFRRDDALRCRRLLPDGFSFTSTITMALLGEGRRVDYMPITYDARVGSSKIRPVRDLSGFVMLLVRLALAFAPLKVFGPLSGFLVAVGVALLAGRMFMAEPFGVATTVVFLLGGVQVFALGLLADLINRRGQA